jgi:hypothetical protein
MSVEKLFREILRWEFNRLKFNAMMFVSGILLYFIINIIMPLDIHGWSQGKAVSNYYSAAIFAYGLFANFLYTVIYAYTILLKVKLKMNLLNDEIDPIAKRFILKGGLVANFLISFLEIIYRFQID